MESRTWPEHWFDLPMAVVDVETTGFNPDEDRIIEIGIVHFIAGEVSETWGQLINPGRAIPEAVVTLTGIRDEDVADKPPFEAVAAEVAARLSNRGIVAYNLPFDRSFIRAELARAGLSWPEASPTFDPLIFARQFHRDARSKKLGAVAERLGIDLVEAHRAVDDATTAGHILYAFRHQLPPRLHDLQVLQVQWEQQQSQQTAHWRRNRPNQDQGSDWMGGGQSKQAIGLGPAYVYGEEPDPLRALYMTLPEAPRS